jgi:hypothetical protein
MKNSWRGQSVPRYKGEVVTRPTMRFVEVKTPEQQAILAVHRTRDLIVRQRTQTIIMLQAQLAEFGVDLPQGVYYPSRLMSFQVQCGSVSRADGSPRSCHLIPRHDRDVARISR